jgi:hypothetical protein
MDFVTLVAVCAPDGGTPCPAPLRACCATAEAFGVGGRGRGGAAC